MQGLRANLKGHCILLCGRVLCIGVCDFEIIVVAQGDGVCLFCSMDAKFENSNNVEVLYIGDKKPIELIEGLIE